MGGDLHKWFTIVVHEAAILHADTFTAWTSWTAPPLLWDLGISPPALGAGLHWRYGQDNTCLWKG